MEKINFNFPAACFHVEKILDVADVSDKHKTYKVQWAASWVSEVHLVGCHDLMAQFHHKSNNERSDIASDCTGVITSRDRFNHCEMGDEPELTSNEQLSGSISTETTFENVFNNGTCDGPPASQSAEYIDPYSDLSIIEIKEEIDECDLDENTLVPSSEVNLPTKYEDDTLLNDLLGDDDIEETSRDSENDSAPMKSLLTDIDEARVTFKLNNHDDDRSRLITLKTSSRKQIMKYDCNADPEFMDTILIEDDATFHEVVQPGLIKQLLTRTNENIVPSPVSVLKYDNLDKANLPKSYSVSVESPITNASSLDEVTISEIPQQRHKDPTLLSEIVSATSEGVPYTCQHCNENVVTITKYLDHLKVFHSIVACKICFEEFNEKLACQMHQMDAHNLECPQCEICGVKLSTRWCLKVHIKRKHSKERPHKCNSCNKSFSMSGDLRKHERLHTGERPYSCEYCHQRFSDSSALFVHRRRKHQTDVQSLKCDLCSKKFPSKNYMKKHRCKGAYT